MKSRFDNIATKDITDEEAGLKSIISNPSGRHAADERLDALAEYLGLVKQHPDDEERSVKYANIQRAFTYLSSVKFYTKDPVLKVGIDTALISLRETYPEMKNIFDDLGHTYGRIMRSRPDSRMIR